MVKGGQGLNALRGNVQVSGKETSRQRAKQVRSPLEGRCSARWRSRQEASVALGESRVGAEREDRADGPGGLLRVLRVFGVFSGTGGHGEFWLLFWKLTLTSPYTDHEAGRAGDLEAERTLGKLLQYVQ